MVTPKVKIVVEKFGRKYILTNNDTKKDKDKPYFIMDGEGQGRALNQEDLFDAFEYFFDGY